MIKIISKKQYDTMVRLLKEALTIVKDLQAERDFYKKSWEDLQDFCMNFSKDKDIDFPATEKLHEDKLF